jgi:DNA gyrase subunit B
MRPLLENGMVYAAQPPLFATKLRGELIYAYTDQERATIGEERGIPLDRWKRFKGLGEMNVEELAETTLNRETRILKRMDMDDGRHAEKAAKLFEILMGSDVATRKDYIVSNSGLIDQQLLDI